MAQRIPLPSPLTPSRPFTDAKRRESGTRVRSIRGANDARPDDQHAATIDVYPDAETVAEPELPATSGHGDSAPISDEALEARLLFETRAVAERRLAIAGEENDKPTRRVDALADRTVERTLMGMSPPPPPSPEPTPMPSREESLSLRISIDLSSMMRTARLRLRRSRTVRVLALVFFVALVGSFVWLLQSRDPGFANTRAAIAKFVHAIFA